MKCAIDSLLKYAQTYHLNSLWGTERADKLLHFMSNHGRFKLAIIDNGTELKNSVVSKLLKVYKINHFRSPNYPQSNEVVERFHSPIS